MWEEGRVPAVVLAGGINRIRLFEGYRPGAKALLQFAGKPSVRYLLEALRQVPQVGRIALVGSTGELRGAVGEGEGVELVEGEKTLGANILLGLRHFSGAPAVLFTTADAPLIGAGAVAAFLQACAAKKPEGGGGLAFFSFVPQTAFTGPYQGRQKARLMFRDGIFCHGNLALVDPGLAARMALFPRIDHLYQVRKETLKTILAFGWTLAATYVVGAWLLRRLSIDTMAAIASRRLGVQLVPVLLEWPEVVVDIDEPEDYAFVRRMLEDSS